MGLLSYLACPSVCLPALLFCPQVQPEFSLRILDEAYAKENKTIRQIQVRPARGAWLINCSGVRHRATTGHPMEHTASHAFFCL